jgi:glycine/D-amino acid oxidase-like deaminating enzyme
VYENSFVTTVSESGPPHVLTTAEGRITADAVVLATHLPMLDRSMHFTMASPSREYCIAIKPPDRATVPQMVSPRCQSRYPWHHPRHASAAM